jgi:transposase
MHPDAAGIDIGSTEHFVAVPADRDAASVRSFGVLTAELHAMARWLKACRVTTVAMESTGVYWIPVAEVLEGHALEVLLVDAAHVKHVPGRKSDVTDCQWLQELHGFGLLRGAFRPEQEIRVLRAYWRQREDLVEQCARQIHMMHKALEQMNLQLHKVLTDVTGVSGQAILRTILAGERDPAVLAALAQPGVKSPPEVIAGALTGEYREEHLFVLRQAVELYDVFQYKIAACDEQLQQYMARLAPAAPTGKTPSPTTPPKRSRRRRKNQPHFDLSTELVRLTGVDLTRIDGISASTAQTVLSECGRDLSAFPTEKHFASWLGLCPNHHITGGKIKKKQTRKVRNRAAESLRLAAVSLYRSPTALGAFLRRLKARLGAPKAITATARKLACLVYRMLRHGQDYVDQGQQRYEQQYQERRLHWLHKQARNLGYQLISSQTGECVS